MKEELKAIDTKLVEASIALEEAVKLITQVPEIGEHIVEDNLAVNDYWKKTIEEVGVKGEDLYVDTIEQIAAIAKQVRLIRAVFAVRCKDGV